MLKRGHERSRQRARPVQSPTAGRSAKASGAGTRAGRTWYQMLWAGSGTNHGGLVAWERSYVVF